MPGGRTITIAAPRHCAVAELKRLLADKTDIPAAEQRLLSGGRELEDAHTVNAGSALHLVLDLRGGMEDGDKPPILLPPKRRRAPAAAAGARPPPPPTPQQSDGEASDADHAGGGGDGGDRDSAVGAGEVSAATAMTAEQAAAADSVVVALQLLLHVASPGHGAEYPNDF